MKSLFKVSQRYARALFELARDLNKIDVVTRDMNFLNELMMQSHELMQVFRSPVIPIHKKINILEHIFSRNISELTLEFLKLILRKRRILCLKLIGAQYFHFYYQFYNIQPATIELACEIDEHLLSDIKHLLEKKSGKEVYLSTEIKPELIGGFRLRWLDYVYDATLKHQLDLLRKYYQENIYERKI